MSTIGLAVAAVLSAYALGSLSGSLLLGRWVGVDIRARGSGNAGGTNAFRTLGWRFALGVVLIDVGKGVLAASIPLWLGFGQAFVPWAQAGCVLAATAGHVWPVFFGFRGGKGAATLVGGLMVFWPVALIAVLATWVAVVLASGYVGLATMLATTMLLPMVAVVPTGQRIPYGAFALLAWVFILCTHRSNISRLRAGDEHRFGPWRWRRWK